MTETRQFRLGPMDNFSYVLWDKETREAAVVDPAWQPQRLADFMKAEKLSLQCVLLTHGHPDHVNGAAYFAGGEPPMPVYLHEADHGMLDARIPGLRHVADGETLRAGALKLTVLYTPGHTPGSVCYLAGDAVFTGDTLFIGECGRVDLPGSSPEALYDSFVKLAALPDAAAVYPGHSYNGDTSTFAVQKEYNFYLKLALQKRRADFIKAVT